MAITLVNIAATPTDAGSNAGPTVTLTAPGGMLAGDYIVVVAAYKATSSTINVDNDGGQTWTSEPETSGSSPISRLFHARFNGTWSANPSFTQSTGGTGPLSATMLVFRGVDATTAIDVAPVSGNYSAPSSPFTVTIPGITTVTDGAWAIAVWASADDNDWSGLTAGWTYRNLASNQLKNNAGTDISLSAASKEITTAGATGSVSNNQSARGGDAGSHWILALRPASGAGSQTVSPARLGGTTLNAPSVLRGSVTISPSRLGLASIHAPSLKISLLLSRLGGATLNAPSVLQGAVTVSPARLGLALLHSPSILRGSVTVSPSRLGGATIQSPTITALLGAQTVSVSRLGGTNLHSPSVQPGSVSVAPARLGGATLLVPGFRLRVSPTRLGGATLHAPALARGISVSRLGGAALFAPTLTVITPIAGQAIVGHGLAFPSEHSHQVIANLSTVSDPTTSSGHELLYELEDTHG